MKYLFILLSILAIACNKQSSQNELNPQSISNASEQAQSSNKNPESFLSNSQTLIPGNTLLDSNEWIVNNKNFPYNKDMLFVDAKWQIISQEQFKDSMRSSNYNYGYVLMTREGNEKASKLKMLSKKERESIGKESLDYATIESKKSYRYKYFNTVCPEFSFTDLKGNEYTREKLKGKIVVLNFWYIGCKGCIQEIPNLNDLVDQYKNNGDVVFLAPAIDSFKRLQTYFQKQEFKYTNHDFKYTVATINYFKNQDLINGYPTHIIINRESVMTFLYLGNIITIKEFLDQEIKKLLI